MGRLELVAAKAILFDDGALPSELVTLFADLMALPCSPRRYSAAIERALSEVGISMRLPDVARPIRVDMPRIRIAADVHDELLDPEEHEEATPPARRLVG